MIFHSKKATVTITASGLMPALVTLLTVLLAHYTDLPAEVINSMAEVLCISVGIIVGSYNIGQGIADYKRNSI